MSAIGRSPKIPLSPSSPPETGLKRRRPSNKIPDSPPSPPLMSVATKSYVSYQHSQPSDEMASRSSPRSPNSSSSYTQQSTQRGSQAYSTPTSSTGGIPGLNMAEDSDQHRDKRQKMDSRGKEEEEEKLVEHARPTNHDRQGDVKMEDGASDLGRVSLTDVDGVTLEQIQKDMGEAFLLCRSKVEPQRPNSQRHLLAAYGLGPLLRSVARIDPTNGEKINKLRKSYEGQIKGFGLAGINKPVKGERNVEEDQPGPIRRATGSTLMGLVPDGQWEAEHATTKIEVNTDFHSKLKLAMQMQPGKVRDVDKWDSVLGHEKPRPTIPPPQQIAAPPVPQRIPNGIFRPVGPTMIEARRQTRGKKRSYGDDSFVGYGEGFSDVEGDMYGDGDDADEDGGRKHKRRRESNTGAITYGQTLGR